MRTIAVVNQKGGCGKTTLAVNIAAAWARRGARTLLVDLDPQAHATLGLGVPAPAPEASVGRALAKSGLDADVVPLRSILVESEDGVTVAPSSAELAAAEAEWGGASGAEERLGEHLAVLSDAFDRVVVDAPPSLGVLTLNALTAADGVLVPVEPSLFALHGLARLVELRRVLTERTGHASQLQVAVIAFDRRSRFARETLAEIRRTFPDAALEATVRSSVRVREAAARGRSVFRHAARAPVTCDLATLAEEVEARLSRNRPRTADVVKSAGRARRSGLYVRRRGVEPGAVRVAGSFNAWVPDDGVVLERHDDGSWTKFIPLQPGAYEYKLVVDGRWVTDPDNPSSVSTEIGAVNSVIEVEA